MAEHKKLKGSKKRTKDKHEKIDKQRSVKAKKEQKKGWVDRSGKRKNK